MYNIHLPRRDWGSAGSIIKRSIFFLSHELKRNDYADLPREKWQVWLWFAIVQVFISPPTFYFTNTLIGTGWPKKKGTLAKVNNPFNTWYWKLQMPHNTLDYIQIMHVKWFCSVSKRIFVMALLKTTLMYQNIRNIAKILRFQKWSI